MPNKTILVVDDLGTLRQPVRMVLERRGYAVEEASNGHEALQKMSQSRPDLILLDLMMPVMSGSEVLKQTQADVRLQGIPVIVLTAVADGRRMPRYVELGAIDYLLKPFTTATLLERVRRALGEETLAL